MASLGRGSVCPLRAWLCLGCSVALDLLCATLFPGLLVFLCPDSVTLTCLCVVCVPVPVLVPWVVNWGSKQRSRIQIHTDDDVFYEFAHRIGYY